MDFPRYEYITVPFDQDRINGLGKEGWRLVKILDSTTMPPNVVGLPIGTRYMAILERTLDDKLEK